MMNNQSSQYCGRYCINEEEWKKAQAALRLAKRFGLIDDDSILALEKRRKEKNEENAKKKENGELFYGPCVYTPPMYLQYELTRFRLDFVQPSAKIKALGVCPTFSQNEKRAFYEANQDLFRRYHGDLFSYEDVEQIIEKRLREEAYDRFIQDILCQSGEWK